VVGALIQYGEMALAPQHSLLHGAVETGRNGRSGGGHLCFAQNWRRLKVALGRMGSVGFQTDTRSVGVHHEKKKPPNATSPTTAKYRSIRAAPLKPVDQVGLLTLKSPAALLAQALYPRRQACRRLSDWGVRRQLIEARF